MKIYKKTQITEKVENILDKVFCNSCGEEIPLENYQEYFTAEKVWGYNSDWDNRKDKFDLCCNCYNKIVTTFKIPIYDNEND